MEKSTILFVLVLNLILIFISPGSCFQWSSSSGSDRVRLTDVSTITLQSNQLTTGRRSSPVPQLQCVGGTAGCRDYLPKAVQCYNRGSDGNDVQWECKAEMDNAYQFGRIQVTCEGYEYPDDPYVLKGSCGLEYELDHTRAGRSYDQSGGSYHHQNHHYSSRSSSSFGDIIMLFILVAVGFAIYKSCIASNRSHTATSYQSAPSYSGTAQQGVNSGTSNGGGFWTGAATGGLLGYLFGNSRNYGGGGWGYGRGSGWGYGGGWGTGHRSRGWGSGYNSGGWGSGYRSGGGWSSGSRSSGSSGGSRTTSGFGGTSRR